MPPEYFVSIVIGALVTTSWGMTRFKGVGADELAVCGEVRGPRFEGIQRLNAPTPACAPSLLCNWVLGKSVVVVGSLFLLELECSKRLLLVSLKVSQTALDLALDQASPWPASSVPKYLKL
jgi:hypothetical protein